MSLTEVLLPSTLKLLGTDSFAHCCALKRIDLSETQLESAGEGLLSDCTSLTQALLPKSLKVLGTLAFERCDALERVGLS
jgi:hypothetical protein